MSCGSCLVRRYQMPIKEFYTADSEALATTVPEANSFVLEKIGYDEQKRPLYTMKICDGFNTMENLGYIVPPDTTPAYALGDVEEVCANKDEDGNCACSDDFCFMVNCEASDSTAETED